MSDLCNFSTAYCAAICAFLIPANLLATFWTLWLVGHKRLALQVQQGIALASLLALAMSLHVFSWIAIGVVMAPTYILLGLAGTCLSLNFWAFCHPSSLRTWILAIISKAKNILQHRALSAIHPQEML